MAAVSASATTATDSPDKCAAYVVAECEFGKFLTWRQSDSACHCVLEDDDCAAPSADVGMDIYTITRGNLDHITIHFCQSLVWRIYDRLRPESIEYLVC